MNNIKSVFFTYQTHDALVLFINNYSLLWSIPIWFLNYFRTNASLMVSTKILSSQMVLFASWMPNHYFRKISEGSCDTEVWSNGCWKFSFFFTEINYILKYIPLLLLLNYYLYLLVHYIYTLYIWRVPVQKEQLINIYIFFLKDRSLLWSYNRNYK